MLVKFVEYSKIRTDQSHASIFFPLDLQAEMTKIVDSDRPRERQ